MMPGALLAASFAPANLLGRSGGRLFVEWTPLQQRLVSGAWTRETGADCEVQSSIQSHGDSQAIQQTDNNIDQSSSPKNGPLSEAKTAYPEAVMKFGIGDCPFVHCEVETRGFRVVCASGLSSR